MYQNDNLLFLEDCGEHVETWRPILGYEGFYEASDHGRVRSLDREVRGSHGSTRKIRGTVLSPSLNTTGYLVVCLRKHGRGTTYGLHTLVALAFHGVRPPGYYCCHNDGNPWNNRPWNLRWDTPSANVQDMLRHGTHASQVNDPKTHCINGHEFTTENTLPGYSRGKKYRVCRACERRKQASYHQRVRKLRRHQGYYQ